MFRHGLRSVGYGFCSLIATSSVVLSAEPRSEWVHPGPDGKLVYKATPRGDRIMDFSFAGYGGGGVALPDVPVVQTLEATSGGDRSKEIQSALDAIAKRPLANGFRGALQLGKGEFDCESTLTISASGIVLRGSGDAEGGTTLKLIGKPHRAIDVGDKIEIKTTGAPATITDSYVASGTHTFRVDDASRFHVGDEILIQKPVTREWIHFMNMDTLVRNDKPQTWLAADSTLSARHRISGINANQITVELPLADSYDAAFTGPAGTKMFHCTTSGELDHIGVEKLRIICPPQQVTINDAAFGGVKISGTRDAWIRNLYVQDTVGGVSVGGGSSRVTVQDVQMHVATPMIGAAKPSDFTADATQLLFNRCSGDGDNTFYFATQARDVGPMVMLDCHFEGNGHIQPHQRWSTGLLLDNCDVPSGGVDLMNRGIMGSGHGWTIGWSVAWNCTAKSLMVQQPPGSMNWAIGCVGDHIAGPRPGHKSGELPKGTVDSQGKPVEPKSLYRAQLADRLGADAVAALAK